MRAGRFILLAVLVIVIIAIAADRGLSLRGGPGAADTDLTVPSPVDPDQPVNPQVDLAPTSPVARPPISLEQPAGFVTGILHGVIAPVTLILSLIMPSIRMYDPTNGGPYYDLGFLLGLMLATALLFAPRYYYRRRAL
jgi:hypothetical protein